MKSSLILGSLAIGVAVMMATACGPMNSEDNTNQTTCTVDALKELEIVDDTVMNDGAAKNASDGALGFRHIIETVAGRPEGASPLTLAWLADWAPPSFTCDWLRRRTENACDATCGNCAGRTLDLAVAPFRLIAVSNRVDLVDEGSGPGEGRLVFAATQGSADDDASAPLPLTVIFEFRLEGDASSWASRWHQLAAHSEMDAGYIADLAQIVGDFATTTTLGQARVNDEWSNSKGLLREFHLESAGAQPRLIASGLNRTPSHVLDGAPALTAFLNENRAAILDDSYELPTALLADRVELGLPWSLPGADPTAGPAFARGTCDGCHGSLQPTLAGGFHVSPFGRGSTKLSRFLLDPANRTGDELARRATVMRRLACSP